MAKLLPPCAPRAALLLSSASNWTSSCIISWCQCCRRNCCTLCTLQILPGRDKGSCCANFNTEMRTRPAAEATKICYLAETGHWNEPEQGLGLVSDWLVREHSYYSSICLASRARRPRKHWGGMRRWGVESCQSGKRRQRTTRRCKEQEDRKMDLTERVERERDGLKGPSNYKESENYWERKGGNIGNK